MSLTSFAVMAVFLLSACAPAAPVVEESPETAPVSLPVPDGCPTAEEFGNAWVRYADFADAIDFTLLAGETNPAVPSGGCAYSRRDVETASDSDARYRFVQVWYFNLNAPGKSTTAELEEWAIAAGGVPSPDSDSVGTNFDLPDDFSGWTGTDLRAAGDESWGWDETIVPAFTQGISARIEFGLDADRVQSLVDASVGGNETQGGDPTAALSLGLAAAFQNTFNMQDSEGYTVGVEVAGRLQAFTSDVSDAPPGQFRAVSISTVGGALTNTTAGRNTDADNVGVAALYPLESTVCAGVSSGVSLPGADGQDSSYCLIGLGQVNGTNLTVDGVAVSEPLEKLLEFGDFPETGSALAEFNRPVSIYALFGTRAGRNDSSWTGDQGCLTRTTQGGTWVTVMLGWPEVICG